MFRGNKKGSSSSSPSTIDPEELELKLNLSTPRRQVGASNPPATIIVGPRRRSTTSPETSPPRSCVSSEDNLSSPEITSMVLAGCPGCIMYVMVPQSDPRCPKCKSPVLLDFLNNNNEDGNHGSVDN